MTSIFNILFGIHPLAPVFFLVVLANGTLAPAIYSMLAKQPYSIGRTRQRASGGDRWAKYAYYSWLLLVVFCLGLVLLVLAALLLR